MNSNRFITDEVFLVRNETESWMMTYEYEQRDATARVTIPVNLVAAILYSFFSPSSTRDIAIGFFVLLATINTIWLLWRMFYDNDYTKSIFRVTVIGDHFLSVIGASLMIILGANDYEITQAQRLIGWAVYFVLGFQICDAVRSTPFLALAGGVTHALVAIISWKLAGYDEFMSASVFFICADLYAILHSVIRLDRLKGHARVSIEQAIFRETNERTRRERIEHGLKKARRLQSKVNQDLAALSFADLNVSFYHRPYEILGGDWVASRVRKDGRLVIVVADVSGKGVEAAIVSQTLQSIWAQSLDSDDFEPMEWILNVNKTLINMGKGQLCTMTMGLIILSKDELQYYCAGHIPLFLVGDKSNRDSVKTITGKGNILGIGPIEVQPVSVDLPKQGDFTLLLGTDGVLDWKTRRNNRSILKIVSDLNREGESALDRRLTEDDKILVRVSRAS